MASKADVQEMVEAVEEVLERKSSPRRVFEVKSSLLAGISGGAPHVRGSQITEDELAAADVDRLIEIGAIAPVMVSQPVTI
jgi:hypothetical protein